MNDGENWLLGVVGASECSLKSAACELQSGAIVSSPRVHLIFARASQLEPWRGWVRQLLSSVRGARKKTVHLCKVTVGARNNSK